MKPSLLIILFLLASANAVADLTEREVIERGLANSHMQARFAARLNAAQGRVDASGNWANPEVEYSQENLDVVGGTSEEATLWLRQEINIAGVNRLNKRSAELALNAEAFSVELAQRDWQRLLRETFYRTLAAQSRTQTLLQYRDRLTAIAQSVQQRVTRGDASRFDALRIEQELAVLNSRYQNALTQRDAQQTRLFNYLDQTPEPLDGELSPPAQNASDSFNAGDHPRLKAMAAEQRSAEIRAQAARRETWPILTIGVGRKELREPLLDANGDTMAVGIEIPIFNRGNGEVQVAQSRARKIQADAVLTRQQLQADYRAAAQSLLSRRQSAEAFRQLLDSEQGSLSQLAEASYQAGELNVLELLDAYRSDLASREQYLETALEARLSFIQLQFLRGE